MLTHLLCLVSATGPTSHSSWEGRRRPSTAPLSGGAWIVRKAETGKKEDILWQPRIYLSMGVFEGYNASLTDRHGSSQIGPAFSSIWSFLGWGEIWKCRGLLAKGSQVALLASIQVWASKKFTK